MSSVHLICLYFFIIVFSIALRKLEAKRRNVEGKLEQSHIYFSQTYGNAVTNSNTHKNKTFKSHYLDTYEGLHLQ